MDYPENYDLFFDSGPVDDIAASVGDFSEPCAVCWPPEEVNLQDSLNSQKLETCTSNDSKLVASQSRRSEGCSRSESKASREKRRRDMLNDRFLELASLMECRKQHKVDKSAILIDAVRMITQLRKEAQSLKESNENLRQNIKELKTEKHELREEKQRLKFEKEQLDQQLRNMKTMQPGYLPFPPAVPISGNKMTPGQSYPAFPMWQFMPPAAVDTSQDHVLRPPVA